MKYIVTEDTIDFVKREVDFSFLAKPERKGYIRLYENNTWETHYLKIIEQCPNSRAYIVERKTPLPYFWRRAFKIYDPQTQKTQTTV